MKTEPTATDIVAATLFRLVDGMREWDSIARTWHRVTEETIIFATPDAIDTDDAATRGAMLAQVREATLLPGVICTMHGDWCVYWPMAYLSGYYCGEGKTEGAALVDAMRKAEE